MTHITATEVRLRNPQFSAQARRISDYILEPLAKRLCSIVMRLETQRETDLARMADDGCPNGGPA